MVQYVDIVKVLLKAGNGGDGKVSFHREKYVTNGGPDGGDGGRGGNVIFVADEGMRTLMDFRIRRKFRADDGEGGAATRRTGKSGKDLVISVPQGTVIRDVKTSRVMADIVDKDEKRVLLRGGRGGAGNARFATPTRQAPNFAKPGERVEEIEVQLEIKSIADVGLVGLPNVGKSSILSVMTAARPEVANYHFTTLTPNLGVVRVGDDGFVMADIPGLIEGAASGAGLGHAFLRHVERTRVLLHVLDISGSEGRDPLEDYEVIRDELRLYGELSHRPQIILANKMDLEDAQENLARLREKLGEDAVIYPVSAATAQGFADLPYKIKNALDDAPALQEFEEDYVPVEVIEKEPFVVTRGDDGWFVVQGPAIDRLMQSVNTGDVDSMAWFERMLRRLGVYDALRARGAKDGDEVELGSIQFDFVD